MAAILMAAVTAIVAAAPFFAQELSKRRGFSIKITQPSNQDIVFGKTKITADVKIDKAEAIEKVEFYVGDQLIFIDEEAPYECFYDFGQESKEVVVRAVAYHREGITVSDFVVTRKIPFSYAVKVNRVVLTASVYDKEGFFVTDLGKGDFELREEGTVQHIVDFTRETRPILMGILMDVSGSMQESLSETQKAASGFVDTLSDQDRAMLVEFNEKVYMLSDLSNDKTALKRLIESTKALGGTSIYDSLHTTLRRLSKFDARKAVVLLTDGDDTNSQIDYKKIVEEMQGSDVVLYTIALGGSFTNPESRSRLSDLAAATGGRYFNANKAKVLAGVYSKIADELRSQYYLTYASENDKFDGRWIPIELRMKRKDLDVRSRKGYYAVPPKS